MVARHVELFTVTTPEDLDDLEACLSDGRVESALVEIPHASSALLSAGEFRRVVRLARDHDIEIAFSTDDPLRRELALIVGGRLKIDTGLDPDRDADAATRKLDGVMSPPLAVDTTTQRPAFRPWQAPASGSVAEPMEVEYEQSNPSFSFVVNPPRERRGSSTIRTEPAAHDPLYEVWDGYTPPDPLFHRSQHAAPKKKRRKAGRVVAALMIAAALLASGVMASIVVLPSATIQLTPATQPISATVTYGVALGGRELDIAIEPQPVNAVLSFEAIIPATGKRIEPDGSAAGTILLTNTSTADIVVPAGTMFTSDSGIAFRASDDAVVPAADPFGTLTVGSTTIQVTAATPGPAGNIGPEAIHGQLESGVYVSNRDAFNGGTEREITIVSPEDIAALRQRAEDDLNAQAATALESRLAPDQTMLDGTKQRGEIQYSFDRQVGDDAQVVGVRASLALSASTYRLGDIHQQAREEASRRLAANVGPDTALIPASITIDSPQPVADSDGLAFTISASATTRSIIDPTELARLESDLAGMNAEQAMARIQQVKGVDGVDVHYERDWLGERMPRLQSRISIEVLDATGVSSQATTSGP